MIILAACASGVGPDTTSTSPGEEILGLSEQARQLGAAQHQLEILSDGEVTFAEYESSMQQAFACLEQEGIDVRQMGIDESDGFPVLSYAIAATAEGLTEDQTQNLADECTRKHSEFVELAWQVYSAEAIEANEARWERVKGPLVDCLEDAGESLPDDASRNELLAGASGLLESQGVDCLTEVGFFD